MVLRIFIFLLICFPVVAAKSQNDTFEFTIKNSQCPVKIQKNKKWINSTSSLEIGTKVIAKKTQNDSDIVIFKTTSPKSPVYAAKYTCLVPPVVAAPTPEPKLVEPKPENLLRASLSLWSWQEIMSSKYGSQNEIPLRATVFGACPGLQWTELRPSSELGLSTCFLYAKSQVSDASEDTVTKEDDNGVPISNPNNYIATYKVRNMDIFGLMIAPSWHYRPFSSQVAIGVQIPLLARYAVFVETQEATPFTFSPRFWLLTGLVLESRFEWQPFHISQKIGFFNKPNSFAWSFEAGYQF